VAGHVGAKPREQFVNLIASKTTQQRERFALPQTEGRSRSSERSLVVICHP
jgi:hypothetical protein